MTPLRSILQDHAGGEQIRKKKKKKSKAVGLAEAVTDSTMHRPALINVNPASVCPFNQYQHRQCPRHHGHRQGFRSGQGQAQEAPRLALVAFRPKGEATFL